VRDRRFKFKTILKDIGFDYTGDNHIVQGGVKPDEAKKVTEEKAAEQ
jgi:hypothetical protein